MKKIMLNDILNLTENEIANSKIGLNMKFDNISHFERWYNSDENNRDVNFNYSAYYGKKGGRNYTKIGQYSFGFVRLKGGNDKWLLISAGEITSLPPRESGPCDHKEIERYNKYIGRLVIRLNKGNTYDRYIFNLSKYINNCEVLEILPNIFEPIQFEGFDNVKLKYSTLKNILEGQKYLGYRNALKGVKGIYCLTDTQTGKLYIGSASGADGVLQRWKDYIDTKTGGNVELIKLYKENGESYFEENFQFTLIETFNRNVDKSVVGKREQYWKDAFVTRKAGYNKN